MLVGVDSVISFSSYTEKFANRSLAMRLSHTGVHVELGESHGTCVVAMRKSDDDDDYVRSMLALVVNRSMIGVVRKSTRVGDVTEVRRGQI